MTAPTPETLIKLATGDTVTVNVTPAEVATALTEAHTTGRPLAQFPTGPHATPTWVAVAHVVELSERPQ